MTPETSAAAVPVRVPANGYAGLPPVGAVAAGDTVRAPANDGTLTIAGAGLPHGVRRLVSALGDIVALVAVVYAVPFGILAIGIPIALLVRLAIWTVRAL